MVVLTITTMGTRIQDLDSSVAVLEEEEVVLVSGVEEE